MDLTRIGHRDEQGEDIKYDDGKCGQGLCDYQGTEVFTKK